MAQIRFYRTSPKRECWKAELPRKDGNLLRECQAMHDEKKSQQLAAEDVEGKEEEGEKMKNEAKEEESQSGKNRGGVRKGKV